jgi:hypothetical protein
MPKDADIAQTALYPQAGALVDRAIAAAEGWLRPVDRIDYRVRRALIPVRFEEPTSSASLKKPSVQHADLSGSVQRAIGQRLRAAYPIERSLSSRLAALLTEFEERNGRGGGFRRDGCVTTA